MFGSHADQPHKDPDESDPAPAYSLPPQPPLFFFNKRLANVKAPPEGSFCLAQTFHHQPNL